METLVVNTFAGPGAGKTKCAWDIGARLKERGLNVEYVPEYAKELVWDGDLKALKEQEHIFDVQLHRIERLIGKVEIIITDSPILLNEIYGVNNSADFKKRIWEAHNKHKTFNLFIKRGNYFQQEGRIHSKERSVQLDNEIKNLLDENNVYYGIYNYDKVNVIVDNIVKTSEKLQKPHFKEKNFEMEM